MAVKQGGPGVPPWITRQMRVPWLARKRPRLP